MKPSKAITKAADAMRRAHQILNATLPAARPQEGEEHDSTLQRQLHELEEHRLTLQKQNQALLELQHAREQINAVLERYTDLYDFAPISYFTLDRDGVLRDANLMGASLLGIDRQQAIGQPFTTFVTADYQEAFVSYLHEVFDSGRKQACELPLLKANSLPFFVHIEANTDASGQTCRAVVVDISERKMTEERLIYLAHHDVITGLPNRALFADRLTQALARARREEQHIGLIFLDLDRFKAVNDTHGHKVGDMLLNVTAQRMKECVRSSDTVARIGGDEFVILLPYNRPIEDVTGVAHKILQALNQPFALAGLQLHISASIGTALFPEHGENEEDLLKNADAAMYLAKQRGGSQVASYQELQQKPLPH